MILHDTKFPAVTFNNQPAFPLKAYRDSDWAACLITYRPVSGYFILLGDKPISWKSKKQVTISLSSVEAEYRSTRQVCAKLAWLTRFFHELKVSNLTPVPLKCDNQATIHIARNLIFHGQKLQNELITLSHVSSQDQYVDVFTKSLNESQNAQAISNQGLQPYPLA
uniref:Reverse transcriptase Ty1/copia-type domain-containing protein n=1 Tax=Lactuca sativa TaxID=4236 RepID=A0A9R1X5Y1_LACSA|nr:hypothetical protein LSAT_V11C700376710 [Lactuca sativa]